MKFLFVLMAVIGLAYCDTSCSAPSPNLLDEFKKFVGLLPLSEIEKVALNYMANDEQVQQVMMFLQGKEFASVVEIVNSQKEMIDLYAFMCKNGVEIYKYLNIVNDIVGLPHVTPAPSRKISPITRTFRQFLDDMEKLIPIQKLEDLFKQEEKTSTVFKEFVDKISSKEFRAMVDKVIALPAVQTFRADLVKLGADIDQLERVVRELLGWNTN